MSKQSEPYVNTALIEKVRRIRQITPEDIELSENINISDLWSKAINFTKDEFIVCICAALQKHPDIVYRVLEEDRRELQRKGKDNGKHQTDT